MTTPTYKQISTSLIIPYAKNSRTHSAVQIHQVVQSINEFGFTNPILIDENNQIIAGHCRFEAAKILQMQTLPCIILSHLSEAQKRAYIIADNKLALNAGWDVNILQSEFNFLKEQDFNIELTGFNLEELCELFPQDEIEVFCDENDCPEPPVESMTKLGDFWVLGEHRLLCGDSTVSTDVERLLGGQAPNTMITDPPYGVNYEADWRAKAKGSKKTKREENSNLKNDDQADWYDSYVLFRGHVAYVLVCGTGRQRTKLEGRAYPNDRLGCSQHCV